MELHQLWRLSARRERADSRSVSNGRLLGRILPILAALSLGVSLPAQQEATGTIQGRVLNIGNQKYLNNAHIVVEGTTIEALTNEYGEYRVTGVPAGEARVRASFTGLDTETSTVEVAPGVAATLDFNLTSRARYGDDKTLMLDTFTVAATREFEGNAIATNEQRYAPNVKVVMAADAFGDVTEGNAGEFLKYLPGVTVDYVAADVRTVSVRGFAANFTNVYLDGLRTTSSASGASGRIFEFEQVSINNASRVEVVKVPTPDIPADSLGGSVNLVSKNAFEQKGASFSYRAYISMNSETAGDIFSKTPGPGNEDTFKVLPGFDFTYTVPVNKKFGLVVTGLSSNQFNEQHRWQTTWNYAQAGATAANPYLQQWQLQDGPKNTFRDSISLKADYKLSDNQSVSVMVQENYYKAFFGNRNINFNMGTNNTPTPSSGTPLTYGPNFVQSATGRASVTRGSSFRDKLGATQAANVKYRFNGRDWELDAGVYAVKSKTWYRETSRGQFSNVGSTMQGVSVVRADNVDFPSHDWVVRDSSGNSLDPYNLSNYRVTTAQNSPIDGKAKMKGTYVDVKRDFAGLSFPLALKAGIAVREEDRDNRRYQERWTFVGADGLANTADDGAGPFLDTRYSSEDPHYGEPLIQWLDPYKLYDHFRANPGHFVLATGSNVTNTARHGVEAETFRRQNSEKVTERVSAAYLQLDGKLFSNRLQFVTGVRFEKTENNGEGLLTNPDAVWQRNPDGTYVDGNASQAGIQRVRRADAGAVGSLQELNLTHLERGFRTSRQYDDYYPSLHLTWNVTDNLIARFAYAKTLGRPDYSNIIPNTVIDEDDNDPNAIGTITIRNSALKPWTGGNFDLSLEYYFDRGGVFSVGAFQKDLTDFWVSRSGTLDQALASELGIDSRFVGWGVSTTVNSGEARISGAEFNAVRTLDFLPGIGRHFTISANGTILHLEGEKGADFRGFIPKAGNFSISWNKSPVSARVTWNYRGRQRNAAQTGAQYGGAAGNFHEYYDSRYNIDLNFEYTFSKRIRFFANARNILNQSQVLERYSPSSALYAAGFRSEEFGVQYALGVKGVW